MPVVLETIAGIYIHLAKTLNVCALKQRTHSQKQKNKTPLN